MHFLSDRDIHLRHPFACIISGSMRNHKTLHLNIFHLLMFGTKYFQEGQFYQSEMKSCRLSSKYEWSHNKMSWFGQWCLISSWFKEWSLLVSNYCQFKLNNEFYSQFEKHQYLQKNIQNLHLSVAPTTEGA